MDVQSIQTQALITFVMPFLIQLAKRSQSAGFAWISQRKPKICMLTSAACGDADVDGDRNRPRAAQPYVDLARFDHARARIRDLCRVSGHSIRRPARAV